MNSQELKESRLRLGLSQQAMSLAMGVHRQTWVKWERGERQPDRAAVRLLEMLLIRHNSRDRCPFCGSDDQYPDSSFISGGRTEYFQVCRGCGCEGPVADSEAESLEKWRERKYEFVDRKPGT